MRVFLAILLCKVTRLILRMMHRGGTALPGKVAMKVCPQLLHVLAKDVKCVVVTGTNGKTTSSRMIEQAYSDAGYNYFSNRSGANLMSGITAEFAMHSSILGRPKCEYAVIECDEAATKQVFKLMSPQVIVVTNIFRDQLDRYGEITHTLDNIRTGILNTPQSTVCLNSDCSLTASLADDIPNKVVFYGVDVPLYSAPVEELSDAAYCIRCKAEYKYDYKTYGHLGGYYCPNCGYRRKRPDVAVVEVLEQSADSSTVIMDVFGEKEQVFINLPAGYNIYNATGSIAALVTVGFSIEAALRAVAGFTCGFGRLEKLDLGNTSLRMILVKNPAGCNQVLNFLSELKDEYILVICLNDNTADGTDVSWIWDVEFERLCSMREQVGSVFVSGIRCYDMALRLKYAGIDHVTVEKDYDLLLKNITNQPKPVYVIPTYTAMLDLRERISKNFGIKEFWEL